MRHALMLIQSQCPWCMQVVPNPGIEVSPTSALEPIVTTCRNCKEQVLVHADLYYHIRRALEGGTNGEEAEPYKDYRP